MTYDAVLPSFRIATRTVRYDEIIVRNTSVEYDLDKKYLDQILQARNFFSSMYIAVRIRLGLRACMLKLRKVRVPARVCLSDPLLKHRTGVKVPVLTTYFLISTAA